MLLVRVTEPWLESQHAVVITVCSGERGRVLCPVAVSGGGPSINSSPSFSSSKLALLQSSATSSRLSYPLWRLASLDQVSSPKMLSVDPGQRVRWSGVGIDVRRNYQKVHSRRTGSNQRQQRGVSFRSYVTYHQYKRDVEFSVPDYSRPSHLEFVRGSSNTKEFYLFLTPRCRPLNPPVSQKFVSTSVNSEPFLFRFLAMSGAKTVLVYPPDQQDARQRRAAEC